ncbi:hypothetical protein [Luteimonas sp. R10]|uniref:hypothetical protein n=1 Tax=Luteimonas sp. R10 TaxID=3108176 RepID=UPI003091C2C6|nr:hypothetical protein U3649_11005 [Luteimonas sp. R10]
MQIHPLTYRLLTKFEFTTPGVDLQRLRVEGYRKRDVLARLEVLEATGLVRVIAARDKTGVPYSGMVVGITKAGWMRLEAMRHLSSRRARRICISPKPDG